VTLPSHPFRGRRFAVVRLLVLVDGRRAVEVDGPDGRLLRLPEAWTDRGAPWTVPQIEGREVRLCARGLLELAHAVAAALDPPPVPSQIRARATRKPPSGPVDVPVRERRTQPTVLGRAADRGAARSARRVGHARSQGASGRSGRGGAS
jgi:hypothetical protein